MARCAAAALLGAIEIYNKPTVAFREQTFAILAVNAWEILLKARIVHLAGGNITSIYKKKGGRYNRVPETNEPFTISLRKALRRISLPSEVDANIRGLMTIRNTATHRGVLVSEACQRVLEFGTASVHNFITLSDEWFGEAPSLPFLLPVGFLGSATAAGGTPKGGQKKLLNILAQLSNTYKASHSKFAVVMHVDFALKRGFADNGGIGLTMAPSAPIVKLSDDVVIEKFDITYSELVELCKQRYSNFKQNQRFRAFIREIKGDAQCAFERYLDPKQVRGQRKWFYDRSEVIAKLDQHYLKVDASKTVEAAA